LGSKTSPEAIQQALKFYSSIGKKTILLRKELPGHVSEPSASGALPGDALPD